ncbi:MAG: hypothetical protein NZT61_07470 [Deltaproteobacteria bacterium]|nr:hypothetical protein [Deltaproteobacteria bacterium]
MPNTKKPFPNFWQKVLIFFYLTNLRLSPIVALLATAGCVLWFSNFVDNLCDWKLLQTLNKNPNHLNWDQQCAVGDFKIPLVSIFGCLLLLMIFSFESTKIIVSWFGTRSCIKVCSRQLAKFGTPTDGPDLAEKHEISRIFESTRIFKPEWDEFSESLIAVPSREKNETANFESDISKARNDWRFQNTKQVEEFFTNDSLNRVFRVSESTSAVLTSLGLFFTFLAILLGLASVKQDPQAVGKIVGVEELVYNLSGKFLSSIVALGLSILFTFLQDLLKSRVMTAFNDLRRRINQIFPFLSVQSLLQDSNEMLSKVTNFVRDLGSDLVKGLQQGVQSSLEPHFQKLSHAIEELRRQKEGSLIEITQQLKSAIEEMVKEFKCSLFSSTQSFFNDFGESVRQFAQELDRISQTYEQANKSILDSGSQLRQISETVCSSISNTLIQQLEALGSGVSTLVGKLEDKFFILLEQVTTGLYQSSRSATEKITHVAEMSQNLQEMALKQLDEAVDRNTQILRSFQEASQGHIQALEAFTEVQEKMQRFSDSMQASYQRLSDIAGKIEIGTHNLNVVASKLQQSCSSVEQIIKVQETVFKNMDDLSENLQKSITELVTSLGNTVENYSKSLRETTGNVLGQFKDALEQASKVFSRDVNELADAVSEFKDHVTSFNGDRAA